jgi:nitroimidazol reductase NimA-like FMN-containing flavoprotein (pyridoxamine 5'-phosphate oxidase superfamily)
MVIEPMSDRDCRKLLARTSLGRLGCSVDNQPYVVPVHVDYYDGFLYGFSMLGQKIEWMRINPLVCVEFDELVTRRQWETVVVFGAYEELIDRPDNADSRKEAQRLFLRRPVWWEPATVPLTGRPRHSPVLFRILIDHMTGRRARLEADETPNPAGRRSRSAQSHWLGRAARGIRPRARG